MSCSSLTKRGSKLCNVPNGMLFFYGLNVINVWVLGTKNIMQRHTVYIKQILIFAKIVLF
jgi:hypothetical protein